MPNSESVVHFLLVDFSEGSSCCYTPDMMMMVMDMMDTGWGGRANIFSMKGGTNIFRPKGGDKHF